jgi:hypothetical protein
MHLSIAYICEWMYVYTVKTGSGVCLLFRLYRIYTVTKKVEMAGAALQSSSENCP